MDEELEAIRRKKMEELKKGEKILDWPHEPVNLTDVSFDAFVNKYPMVVVDCWAPWCGPCRMVSPIVDALAKEMAGKVVFGKLNTDENPAIPSKFRISAIPTLLVFKQGQLADRIVGAMPKEQLAARIKKNL
ncbi:MAG: thioredoxin [Methanomassiliicoccales archaeon]